jgi:hypothetical protein
MLARLALVLLAEMSVGVIVSSLAPALMRAQAQTDMPAAVEPLKAETQAQTQEAQAFRLVSAQVVTASSDRPPLLRLAANGPIAFRVLTSEESGLPQGSPRLAVRLYGVRPGELATLGGLDPFSLVVTAASDGGSSGGSDSIINVGLTGLAPDATLHARAGQRANELEIVATP